MIKNQYVVAFNRDRDSYHVPRALNEVGCLARLITDLYIPDACAASSLVRWLGLDHRRHPSIPSDKVESSAAAILLQILGLRMAQTSRQRLAVFDRLDRGLSRKALKSAIALDAHALLYHGYALECFKAPEMRDRRRILYVYHPAAGLAATILERDLIAFPEVGWSFDFHMAEMAANSAERLTEEMKLATEIVCASGFTRRSIEYAIGTGKLIHVVPLGCSKPAQAAAEIQQSGHRPRLLFVGQGVQRKGLHHLLTVWKGRGDWGADLTIVASKLDPAIKAKAESPGAPVTLMRALPRKQLYREFSAADIFVMPSLIEGFGIVYLEALSAGCFVIGSKNSGLPDLGVSANVASLIEPGNLGDLEAALGAAIARIAGGGTSREEISRFAAACEWDAVCSRLTMALGLSQRGKDTRSALS